MIALDFFTQQQAIFEYIREHFKEYLEALPEPDYVHDFPDPDKYKHEGTLFVQFGHYGFQRLTNESESMTITLSVYLVVRNAVPETLKERLLKYTTAFYQMFDASAQNLGGIVDYGTIESIIIYEYVEGRRDTKASEITLLLTVEL
ncbi:MAG: hypothetical protein LBF75_04785 [Treponema sp.]|jgi:hypothetical protein|nr:hypothetical protein [Treponema sp.]